MSDVPTIGATASEDSNPRIIKIEVMDTSSDNDELVPEMMVSVQVEEADDSLPLDFDYNPKEIKPPKRKKQLESPEERRKRLERDRARKMWARQNETPEQRKARLDYHKKYKRKSRAKPKEEPGTLSIKSLRCEKCRINFNDSEQWQQHIKKVHPFIEDHSLKFAKIRKAQQTLTTIAYDTHSESENIVVKVEPVDYDDCSNSNTVESRNDSDFTQTESDSNPNDSTPRCTRKKYLNYTIQCAIVSKMFKGRPIPDICTLYNVTPEIVNELWEDRQNYILENPGLGYRQKNASIEKKILEWIQLQKDNNIQISGKMIQNAAEGYAKELGFIAFDGSRKWLDRFKKKHKIMFGTRKRDYTATPDNKVKKQFFIEQWAEAREGMSDEDIYTADEIGLFYNPSKNRIQKLRGKKFVQGCVKDRLSIFLCTNASGTDKKKLLVCGTEDPLINSHRDPQTLPVLYVRHAKAHFTTRVFENYVTCWNRELEQCNKKALLVLDRATIHTKMQLSHLKLLFVPYKSKNSLIPVRNGIYTRFRAEFRRLILQNKVMNCMNSADRNITCLEALNMLEKAWERTPPEVITMSLITIGYDVTKPKKENLPTPKAVENDEESMCEVLKNYEVEHYFTNLTLLDQYLTVDDDLLTGQGTNASVFGGNHKPLPKNEVEEHLPIGTQTPECGNVEATVNKEQALQDLEIVKNYLQAKDTSHGTYCSLIEIEKFVRSSDA